MKIKKTAKTLLAITTAAMVMAGVTACGGNSSGKDSSDGTKVSNEEVTKSFSYSATATSSDTDRGADNVTVYTRTYTIELVGMSDNSFTLTCTPSGEKNADYGVNGNSIVTGEQVGTDDAGAELDYTCEFGESTMDTKGTWSYEEGWGYTFTFEDGTEITAGYRSEDKFMYFDYNYSCDYKIVPTDSSIESIEKTDAGIVTLESRVTDFTPDAEYKLPDERYADYVFKGYGTYESWTSEVNVYCQNDGTVKVAYASNFATGTETGTWKLDEANHAFTLELESNRTIRALYDESTDSYAIPYYSGFIKAYAICGNATEENFVDQDYAKVTYKFTSETIDAADQGTCTFGLYLYDDGTCYINNVVAIAETIERNCATGTWEEKDGNITVTINGNTYTCAAGGSLENVTFTYTNPYYGLPWGSAATTDAHDATVTFNSAQ